MKNFAFNKEIILHLLFWTFYFSIMNVAWTENWLDKAVRIDNPAPLSTILMPFFFYLNAFWLIPKFLKGRNWYRYFLVAFLVVFVAELLRATSFVFLNRETTHFFSNLWAELLSDDSFIIGVPNSMFFAFVLSFAYRFTKDWIVNNQVIEALKTEKMAMELQMLKSQINPHFLFNNLNTLDDLIDRNQDLAKAYLHKLSNMYRYSIANSNNDVVSIAEEWRFMEDYIFLLATRFGEIYHFHKEVTLKDWSTHLIPTAALQTLIENVVKHNQGSIENPLHVLITLHNKEVSVSHMKRPKIAQSKSLGTGLKNLKSRYQLLTAQEVIIQDQEKFTVILPLIKQVV